MSRVLNGSQYAVLDKRVSYKEALEWLSKEDGEARVWDLLCSLFDVEVAQLSRDLTRVTEGKCIACGDTKSITRKRHNPVSGQWETYVAECEECEE